MTDDGKGNGNGLDTIRVMLLAQTEAIGGLNQSVGELAGECKGISRRLDRIEKEQTATNDHCHRLSAANDVLSNRIGQTERSVSNLYKTVNESDLTPPPQPPPIKPQPTAEEILAARRQMAEEVTERVKLQMLEKEREQLERSKPVPTLPPPKTWRDHMQTLAMLMGLAITASAIGSWIFRGPGALDPDTVAAIKQVVKQQQLARTASKDAGYGTR